MSKVQYPVFKARLVMGSPTQLRTDDHEGKPQPDEKKHHWFMGFAVPKGPEWETLWGAMYNAAANDPRCTAALCGQAGFNWKTEDCDAPENPQNLGKPSYPAGHMLIKFTRYKAIGPVNLCDGNFQRIVNPDAIKKGDYFHVSASTVFNGAATVKTNAGMYQNIEGLMFAAAGEEIASEGGFDAKLAFANVQGGMVHGGTTPPPQAATTPPPAAQAATTPPPQVATTPPPAAQATSAPVTPAHDLVQPQTPGNATPPPVLAAPVEERFVVQGTVYTKSQLLAMPGWTEAHLVNLTRA